MHCLLLLFAIFIGTLAQGPTTIIKLWELGRHGARAPQFDFFSFNGTGQCCNATNFNNFWAPEGESGLSAIGALQHDINGAFIKERYGNSSALPKTWQPSQIALLAGPSCTRCVYSVLNQTFGIYGQNLSTSLVDTSSYWWNQAPNKSCQAIDVNYAGNIASQRYMDFATQALPFLKSSCANSTMASNCSTWKDADIVETYGNKYCSDNVFSSYYYSSFNGTGVGNSLPPWMSQQQFEACVGALYYGKYYTDYHNSTNPSWTNNSIPIASALQIGNLLQTLAVYFTGNASIAGPPNNVGFTMPPNVGPNTTTVLSVGHETQVAALLAALSVFGDYNYQQPPFASFIMLELHQSQANSSDLYVRALYRWQLYNQTTMNNDILKLPFCAGATMNNGYLCPLNQFVNYLRPMFVAGPLVQAEVCLGNRETRTSVVTTATATVTQTATATKTSNGYKLFSLLFLFSVLV